MSFVEWLVIVLVAVVIVATFTIVDMNGKIQNYKGLYEKKITELNLLEKEKVFWDDYWIGKYDKCKSKLIGNSTKLNVKIGDWIIATKPHYQANGIVEGSYMQSVGKIIEITKAHVIWVGYEMIGETVYKYKRITPMEEFKARAFVKATPVMYEEFESIWVPKTKDSRNDEPKGLP